MALSNGLRELQQLVAHSDNPGGKKLSDVLKERPDLLAFVDEYVEYRQHVSHDASTPATSHGVLGVIQQVVPPATT